jgi:ectoine hydroxylase-related dioxygenase (phytanoyl-CoA dioxygenase family)
MQGTTAAVTLWVALVDCPVESGVLALARGSHRDGVRPYRPLDGSRVAGCDESGLEGSWVADDLAAGDVIGFLSLTVHKALPNLSSSVRLSVDARYQSSAEPVCDATLTAPGDYSWDDLYSTWGPESQWLQRYWEQLPLETVPLDPARFMVGKGQAAD